MRVFKTCILSESVFCLIKYTNSCSRMQKMHSKRPKFQNFPRGGCPPIPLQACAFSLEKCSFAVHCLLSAYTSSLPPTQILIENPEAVSISSHCFKYCLSSTLVLTFSPDASLTNLNYGHSFNLLHLHFGRSM